MFLVGGGFSWGFEGGDGVVVGVCGVLGMGIYDRDGDSKDGSQQILDGGNAWLVVGK